MSYIGATFKYFKKSFWLLFILALPAAVACGCFIKPLFTISFIPLYAKEGIGSFWDIYYLFDPYRLILKIYPVFIVLAGLVVSFSAIMPVIEKHFRMGRLMLKQPLTEMNGTVLPVLKTLLTLVVMYALYAILSAAVISMLHLLIAGRGMPNIASLITVSVVSICLFLLFFFLSLPALFMYPMLSVYGYSYSDAFTGAYAMAGRNKKKIVAGALVPVAVTGFIELLLGFLPMPYFALCITGSVMFVFVFIYIAVYVMTVMFDMTGLERRDIPKYY